MQPRQNLTIIKADGEKDPWNPNKLERSLRAAGANDQLTQEILHHVERDIRDGMSTGDLFKHAFMLLRKRHRPTAARYSLKKAMLQLGPSGFPFERFIARMLEREGYHTKVGQHIRGMCVTHEIDVVAEKDDERIIVEAKYHNSAALKTDVKVALYVHARAQDILRKYEQEDIQNGSARKLNRSWLITNTSFTSQAIEYATCVGLSLTGWNYPKGNTIQDLVEQTQTHPITCLTTLTAGQKQALLVRGKVLCRELLTDLSVLREIGISKDRLSAIVRESTEVCAIDDSVSTTTTRSQSRI